MNIIKWILNCQICNRKKIKNAVKNKAGTALRISLKMFNGNDLPQELLLTTRQETKLRNAFNNNI